MGEIGYNRHEFLYDLRLWEIHLIVMGYRKRNRPMYQLLAEVIYAAMYANPYRKNDGKTAADMFPQYFEDDNDDMEEEPPISEEDYQELVSIMRTYNNKKADTI